LKLAKKNQYRCKNTGKDFNVLTGTIFENSNIPIRKWFYVLAGFSSRLNGTSSYQLIDEIGVTHKSG
jgi:transposase-like protein